MNNHPKRKNRQKNPLLGLLAVLFAHLEVNSVAGVRLELTTFGL